MNLLTSRSPCRPDLSGSLDIAKPDWETFAQEAADQVVARQTPEQLLEVRAKLYELLVHAIPATLIMKTMLDQILKKVDPRLQAPIVAKAAHYVSSDRCLTSDATLMNLVLTLCQQLRIRQGTKAILHLEAWLAQTMSLIKNNAMDF